MTIREEIMKRIDRKQEEIRELELKIREALAFIQGLQETLRLLPKDTQPQQTSPDKILRPGSLVAKSRDAIKRAGRPLHINDLLTVLGLPSDRKARISLSGSLASYVRKGEIFTRSAPNVFGLIEMADRANHNVPDVEDDGKEHKSPKEDLV
jgi:hypothetical protein